MNEADVIIGEICGLLRERHDGQKPVPSFRSAFPTRKGHRLVSTDAMVDRIERDDYGGENVTGEKIGELRNGTWPEERVY